MQNYLKNNVEFLNYHKKIPERIQELYILIKILKKRKSAARLEWSSFFLHWQKRWQKK